MTGIMGMIYYDYITDSSKVAEEVEKPKTFLQLNNYYYNFTYGYNREPLLFDSDGINISKTCDTRSQMKTLSINMDTIYDIKLNRLNPNPNKLNALDQDGEEGWYYIYSLPMLDYGEWSKIRSISDVVEDVGEGLAGLITDTFGTECEYTKSSYRDVHLDAERCGVSNYLLLSYKENNIEFNCDEWYNTLIDKFVKEDKITLNKVQNNDPKTMEQLAFAYAMDENDRDILTRYEMRTYCYGSPTEQAVNSKPCNVINDYVDIRGDFLEYVLYPTCYSYRIGVN